jgi:hypothetical protein
MDQRPRVEIRCVASPRCADELMSDFATAGYRTERLGATGDETPTLLNTRKAEESARNPTVTASLQRRGRLLERGRRPSTAAVSSDGRKIGGPCLAIRSRRDRPLDRMEAATPGPGRGCSLVHDELRRLTKRHMAGGASGRLWPPRRP